MPPRCGVDVGKLTQRDDDVEAGHGRRRHRDGTGELLEVFGCRFVGHLVDDDEGV
jgi:hypothetical protein